MAGVEDTQVLDKDHMELIDVLQQICESSGRSGDAGVAALADRGLELSYRIAGKINGGVYGKSDLHGQ